MLSENESVDDGFSDLWEKKAKVIQHCYVVKIGALHDYITWAACLLKVFGY